LYLSVPSWRDVRQAGGGRVKLPRGANLSHRILTALADEFPNSAHVWDFRLDPSGDAI